MTAPRIEIWPIHGIRNLQEGDIVGDLIADAIEAQNMNISESDVLVVSHKVVSKAEGRIYRISEIVPSLRALEISQSTGIGPEKVELALRLSEEVIRDSPVLITRTMQGIVTDYSGVDSSNAPEGCLVALPEDPDRSAREIHEQLLERLQIRLSVIVCDTQGRPWRRGAVNIAIGVAGMDPFTRNAGKTDLYGRTLKSSLVCIADELAAAAELFMGQADEAVPAVLISGVLTEDKAGTARDIVRPDGENLFR